MINAISNNTMSAQPLKPQAQSFGRDETPGRTMRPRHQQSALGWSANQFAKGAVISVDSDSLFNGFNAIRGKGAKIGFNKMAANAGFWGLAWIAMGLVFEGIDKLSSRKK